MAGLVSKSLEKGLTELPAVIWTMFKNYKVVLLQMWVRFSKTFNIMVMGMVGRITGLAC